ncbi:oligosaccharide flippase family protein [Streptococcus iniae]|uniref:oligosaccharide flippase family protein n=1 Tax=Streptococcus iniae TaxID=1346 RepID=UPI002B2A5324|nr:oligosaccharide flippase family protein [Streptococcus iniae]
MRLKNEKIQETTKVSSLLIVLSGLVSKILATLYKIPYQNLVGDRGVYAYQQVYPLLAIISALSLTALPNVIASIAQKNSQKDLEILFKIQFYVSTGLSILLLIFSYSLANLLGSIYLTPSIIMTALVLVTVPFISFYRGMAQANADMLPTAISQVLEQIIRVTIIILSALLFYFCDWTVYFTANVATSGNLVASVCVLIYLIKKSSYSAKSMMTVKKLSFGQMHGIGLSTILFIFYSIYLLLFQFLDSIFVKNSLVLSGFSQITAEASKGIYDRGQPLIQFGLIFSTALFTSYLPKLTKLFYENTSNYQEESQSFFEFIFYFNLTLTIGFGSILHLMNHFLFENNKGFLALEIYLTIIVLSSLIQYFHQKAFIETKFKASFLFLVIGLALKMILTPFLTYHFGIIGSSLSTVVPLVIVLFCYLKNSQITVTVFTNIKYYFSIAMMLLMVYLVQIIIPSHSRVTALITLVIATFLGMVVFLSLCHQLMVFDQKLWYYLPLHKEK